MDDASSPWARVRTKPHLSSAIAAQARPRRRASVVGILGEILITLGVVTLLFVAWQLWIGDVIYGAERGAQAAEQSELWQ